MAADTGVGAAERVAGLDRLELGPRKDGGPGVWARKLWKGTWPKVLAIVIVVGAWQLVVLAEWRPVFVLPPPSRVFDELVRVVPTASFWDSVLLTMGRAATGFGLAVAIGMIIGIAVARFQPLRAAIGSLITGMQTMPSIVWFPFAILLFKISEEAILFVVVLGAAPSIANGLISGIDYVPPTWKRVGQILGMRGFGLYRHLIIPAALPSFVSGLKQGWAFAWRSLMAGELLVIVPGALSIGVRLQTSRDLNDAPGLLAYVIIVLCVGIVVDIVFSAADKALRRRWGLTV
ncbi:ABC transporter permease [Phytomonospora endophytica]|uniref:NitT/TauT family transport system permease protein n=1 Tax=Phytomonospora endophytica TaxID=714109 RepID=A0A841FLB5_9ACTN|nr:ABC transporter permease [Phytomonospora endophytica]MBB6038121.1 NitT/TauT family transport system permease protein [Phytomonospora endophytica]GIG67416.1 sulfate ABC transporter permease [Phytomonospora endophytica]